MRRLGLALVLFMVVVAAPVLALEGLPAWTPDANAAREAIPDVYKWDLTPLFASDEAWEAELARLAREVPKLGEFKGRLTDPQALLGALELYFRLHNEINHTTLYANLRLNTELSNNRLQAMQQRSLTLMDSLMRTAGFIRSELLALTDEQMMASYAVEPKLRRYTVYMDNLRRRRSRVLGEEAERVLALAGDNLWAEIDLNEIPSGFESAFGSLMTDIEWPTIRDEDGQEVQMTLANYGRFRSSKKREVRREAVSEFFRTLKQHQNVFAATLGGQYEFSVFLARARGYDSAIEAYLDKDNIDVAVYENLIATVNANLGPLHRYVELRKKLLGYDDLHIYDLYVPLVAGADVEVPFPEARETILTALEPLGENVLRVLEQGMDPRNGWIDLYPSADKESGAFSASVYGRHPYVKMNYQDSVDDMFTLAHEYGHAVHSYLAMSARGYSSFRYVPFIAEVASTCNEALLGDYLIAHAQEPDYKAALLAERLESIRTTIYRQALFAEFEKTVHGYVEQGRPITAKLLNRTYADLIERYYGPGFTMDENDDIEWAYIPHFYYKYYVFTYATGLSSGIALAERIREGGDEAREDYLNMLTGGCARPPLTLLRDAGVDLTEPGAIESALKLMDRTIDELEALVDR